MIFVDREGRRVCQYEEVRGKTYIFVFNPLISSPQNEVLEVLVGITPVLHGRIYGFGFYSKKGFSSHARG